LAKNKIMTIAYVSAALNLVDPDPDLDWDIFEQACKKIDLKVEKVFWNDERVDWAKYDLVVIRSPWDYTSQREEFLTWARQVENQVVLLNNFETIEKNTDKRYLLELANFVPVIPTLFLKPGQINKEDLQELLIQAEALAIKPKIGAGASLAGRAESLDVASELIEKIHEAGRLAMVQPYLKEVDSLGEIAIVLIDGEISHAVKKVPALTKGGHGDAQELIAVTDEMREFVAKLSKIVVNWQSLLYARVDVVPTSDGLVLMELELTEPTLFFPQQPSAAEKLAQGIYKRLTR
jgi:glutathione synthase/RimK-type ligase-like ATP-grasp enzyme